MAHILYRGGAGRSGGTQDGARAEDFRPDDFLYGDPDAQGAQASRFDDAHFDGARLEAARFAGMQEEDAAFGSSLGRGHGFDDPDYDDRFAQQTAARAARGRMHYAPSQHPAVHQSLMQAVRDENPAVQHFIDLQRAAEARAAQLAAALAARQEEARLRAEQARVAEAARAQAEQARAFAAQDGLGWRAPDQDPRVSAAAQSAAMEAAAAKAQAEATRQSAARQAAARQAALRAQQAAPFDPRVALAAWLPEGGMQWLMQRAAGVASVVMALGLGVWGYQLAQRDIAGLQVIKAPEGPAREAPLDPGGELARHTGLAVNSVAAIGTAAPMADQITLAPRAAELDGADAPMSALKPLPAQAAPAPQPVPPTNSPAANPSGERMFDAAMPIPDAAFNQPVSQAGAQVAAPLGEDLTPREADETQGARAAAVAEPAPEAAPEAAPETTSEMGGTATIAASVPGLATSPRPVPRPNSDLQAEAAAVAVADAMAPEVPDAIEISPDKLASGTRLVQIGAHDSADQARAEWDRISAQFAALMDGKRRVIQEAVSGGRTFYRLRVEGFTDVTEARHFCAALVAERTNCIPAQVR